MILVGGYILILSRKAVYLKKRSLGVSEIDFIDDINKDKLIQLSREFHKDRPKSLPQKEKNIVVEDKASKTQKQYSYNHLSNLNKGRFFLIFFLNDLKMLLRVRSLSIKAFSASK